MKRIFVSGVGSAFFALASANSAAADLTAQDVWSNWKDYMSSTGYQISGSEQTSGTVLTVSDLVMMVPNPDDQGEVKMTMDQLVFTGNGDGTVSVQMPDTFPMSITATDPDGDLFDATLGYSQGNHVLLASGDPGDFKYSYSADQVGIALTALSIDGETIPSDSAKLDVALTNVANETTLTGTDTFSVVQQMTSDALTYDVRFKDVDSDVDFAISGAMQALEFGGDATLPQNVDTADIQQMLSAGFKFDGAFGYGKGQSKIDSDTEGQTFAAESSSDGGTIRIAMDAQSLIYDVLQSNSAVSVTSGDLPFPIDLNLVRSGFKLAMPVAKSDAEQDFALSITLGDFTMSETLWGLFDPAQALPRDPASVLLDLSGKAKVLVDFLSPDIAEELEQAETPPGELNALSINDLLASVAGAKLTGSGAFTFDNSAPSPFGAMPAPNGGVDLELAGANGLLDTLIEMGLVTDEDAMGPRMMMGMLAVPGDAPDTLISKIEINEEGHIMANGQRIQ